MISFIIVNFNTAKLTLECIQSIKMYSKLCYEIIVVDNASAVNDLEILKCANDEIKLIQSKQNIGFGAGNMLGANFATGKYLCFINSDVVLVEDCLSPLVDYLLEHDDVGCITPQQYNGMGKLVPSFNHENSIATLLFPRKVLEWVLPSKYPQRRKKYMNPFKAHHVNGSFMLFPSQVFWKCGGFDLNIFLYGEEYDIAMRLLCMRKYCVVHPKYSFVHKCGESVKNTRSLTKMEGYISEIYTYSKYHNILLSCIYRLIIVLRLFIKVKYWYVLPSVISCSPLSFSMRHNKFKQYCK